MSTEYISTEIHNKKSLSFWNSRLLSIGLPLLLGLVLGPLLAALIVVADWFYALPILFLIPVTILLIRYPFAVIMIWVAIQPWFPFDDTYKYVFYLVHRILIPLGLGIVLLSRMLRLKKQRPVRLGPADLAMIAFGALGLVSIFIYRNNWKLMFSLQDQFLVPFMAYWLIRFSNAQKRELKQLIPVLLLVSLAQYVIGLVSWFAPQALPSIWNTGLVGDRIVGTLRQPAAFGSAVILFWVFSYYDAMNQEKKRHVRALQMLAFVLGLVCIFLTFTRGVWLAGILVLLALLYLYPKSTGSLMAIVVPIIAILLVGVFPGELEHAYERFYAKETTESRIILANAGKDMFYARPVFGWGFANYDRYDWRFMVRSGDAAPSKWDVESGTSHHTYFTILAEMGAIGFFLYAFPIVWWLALTPKALRRLPKEGFWSRRLLIVMWLPIGAHLLLAQDIDMRFFPYVLTLFWMTLGFIANIVESSLPVGEVGLTGQDV